MSSAMNLVNDFLPVIEEWSDFLVIDSDEKLDRALEVIEVLVDRFNYGEDHLSKVIEILSESIEKYEKKYTFDKPSGVEMLKFLMDQNGHRQLDLTDIAPKSVICEILSGKRKLNLNHIKKLSVKYSIDPSAFI